MPQQDSSSHDQDAVVRALNASIAEAYDQVVYEPQLNPLLLPESVLGLSALYGCPASGGDVMDLGCGTGTQLAAAGERMPGRLVGIDISREATARARTRCAGFGDRADIRHADFLDLDADELGQFDLIYVVGVFYATPPQVRRRILDLLRRCLKPGGVAVISYYAGVVPFLHAGIIKLARAMDDPSAPVPARISAVRRQLDDLARSIPSASHQAPVMRRVIQRLAAMRDALFFHEFFNYAFDVVDTATLAAELAPAGLEFLTYLPNDQSGSLPSSRERAVAAAAKDLLAGGYQFAVFGKPAAGATGIDVRTPLVDWHFDMLRRESVDGVATFADAKTSINVSSASTAAALEMLAQGPLSWAELCAAAGPYLDPAAPEAGYRQLEKDIVKLWRFGLARATCRFSAPG